MIFSLTVAFRIAGMVGIGHLCFRCCDEVVMCEVVHGKLQAIFLAVPRGIYLNVCMVHSDLMYVNMYDMLGCRLRGYPVKPRCVETSESEIQKQKMT